MPPPVQWSEDNNWETWDEEFPKPSAQTTSGPSQFRYNPLHDLESLWWIAVWFVIGGTLRITPPKSCDCIPDHYATQPWYKEELQRLQLQRQVAKELFVTRQTRVEVLTSSTWFGANICTLHYSIGRIGSALNAIRRMLVISYSQAEKDCENVPPDSGDKIYGMFWKILLGFRQSMKASKDIIVTPL